MDLGVCLASVQVREGHPNLGKESQVTASVAATFYNLYNFRGQEGGRPGREEAERGGRKPQKGEEIDIDWMRLCFALVRICFCFALMRLLH